MDNKGIKEVVVVMVEEKDYHPSRQPWYHHILQDVESGTQNYNTILNCIEIGSPQTKKRNHWKTERKESKHDQEKV